MNTESPIVHPTGIYTPSEVANMIGINRQTLTRLQKAGSLPYPRELSAHTLRYLGQDIIDALASAPRVKRMN